LTGESTVNGLSNHPQFIIPPPYPHPFRAPPNSAPAPRRIRHTPSPAPCDSEPLSAYPPYDFQNTPSGLSVHGKPVAPGCAPSPLHAVRSDPPAGATRRASTPRRSCSPFPALHLADVQSWRDRPLSSGQSPPPTFVSGNAALSTYTIEACAWARWEGAAGRTLPLRGSSPDGPRPWPHELHHAEAAHAWL
jgi:hypothetical protein